jgi:protein-disulfide isomerase
MTPKRIHVRAILALLAGLTLAGTAARAASFTPEQRAEIVRIMRDALASDPSILRDAIREMQSEADAGEAKAAAAAIAANRAALFSDPADPGAGNPAGDVTIVEFYDTRCPFCRRLAPTMAALLAADPNVRVVYKDWPILGPSSLLEARVLLAAQRQGGYRRLQQQLMRATEPATRESIRAESATLGLDGARLLRDIDDPSIAARLEANANLARALGVRGTPAIVVGQRIIPGAVDLSELREAVAAARQGQ